MLESPDPELAQHIANQENSSEVCLFQEGKTCVSLVPNTNLVRVQNLMTGAFVDVLVSACGVEISASGSMILTQRNGTPVVRVCSGGG